MQRKCQIYEHLDELIIGMCQNAECEQHTRLVCLKCVRSLHNKDKDFQISDIMSFDELNYLIKEFNQSQLERNQNISQICQINKYLLMKEIQQYMSFWQQKFNQWHYAEETLYQIACQEKAFNLDNYINDKQNKYNLKDFMIQQTEKSYNDINLILKGQLNDELKRRFGQQKIDLIEEVNDILSKLTDSMKQKIDKSNDQMLQFIVDSKVIENQNQIPIIYEKFCHYFQMIDNVYIDEKIKSFKVLDISQSDEYFKQLICRNGLLLSKLGRIEESINYFKTLLHLFPQNYQAYAHLAEQLKDHIDYQATVNVLNEKIQKNKEDSEDSEDYYEKKRINHYLIYLKNNQKIYKNLNTQLKQYDNEIKKFQDYQEIIKYWDQCIKFCPNYGDAYSRKAKLLKDRDLKEAIDCLDSCIKTIPNYGEVYLQKAEYLKLYNVNQAIGCLDQGIKIITNYGELYSQKAIYLIGCSSIEEAIECLDQCIKINQKYEIAYVEKAQQLQNIDQAIKCLDYCININPNYRLAYYYKVDLLVIQKNYKQAIECLNQCIHFNPNYEDSYLKKVELIQLIENQEYIQEVSSCLDQCIKANPHNCQAYVYKAKIYFKQGNCKQAIECLDQCILSNPNNGQVYYIKVCYLQDMLNYEEAIKCWDEYTILNPNNPYIYFSKANLYALLEKYKEATECFEQYCTIDQLIHFKNHPFENCFNFKEPEEFKQFYETQIRFILNIWIPLTIYLNFLNHENIRIQLFP